MWLLLCNFYFYFFFNFTYEICVKNKMNTDIYKQNFSRKNILINLIFNNFPALPGQEWFINENHCNVTSKIPHSKNRQPRKIQHKSHLCFGFFFCISNLREKKNSIVHELNFLKPKVKAKRRNNCTFFICHRWLDIWTSGIFAYPTEANTGEKIRSSDWLNNLKGILYSFIFEFAFMLSSVSV